MHLTHDLPYAEDDAAQYLELPYTDPRFTMVVVLPKPEKGLGVAEDRLLEACGDTLPVEFRLTTVEVTLPRFTLRKRWDLKPVLVGLGMRSAFEPGQADLSGVTGGKADLTISAVTQEALVEVDEAGCRAAATTGISLGITATAPAENIVRFRADRPFVFAVTDRQNRAVLFVGRLVDPGE